MTSAVRSAATVLFVAPFVFAPLLAPACASSQPADLSQVSLDAGQPVGYDECNNAFFADYLKACSVSTDCHGETQCDLAHDFSETARCHPKECTEVSECTAAFKDLCVGDDFHFECNRPNPIDPTECRIVAGASP